jgi:hypothetical protein
MIFFFLYLRDNLAFFFFFFFFLLLLPHVWQEEESTKLKKKKKTKNGQTRPWPRKIKRSPVRACLLFVALCSCRSSSWQSQSQELTRHSFFFHFFTVGGPGGVGKSAIVLQFVTGNYVSEYGACLPHRHYILSVKGGGLTCAALAPRPHHRRLVRRHHPHSLIINYLLFKFYWFL